MFAQQGCHRGEQQGVPAAEPLHYGSLHAHLNLTTLLTRCIIYATGLAVSKAVCSGQIMGGVKPPSPPPPGGDLHCFTLFSVTRLALLFLGHTG